MRSLVSCLFVALVIWAPMTIRAEVLDVHDAVELALERNPFLKSIEERRNEVKGGVREAWADVYPQLAFNSSWNRSRNPSLLNSADFEDLIELFPDYRPATQELYNANVELSQPLYTSGKIGAGIKLAKTVVEITDAQIATVQLDAGLIAAESYFRILEATEGLETIEIQQQTRRESLAVVQARYDLGEATELERLQAEASLAELQPAIDVARGQVRVAKIDLRAVLDFPDDTPIEVEEVDAPLPDKPDPENALVFAFDRRPEFDDLEQQVEALGLQKKIVRADGYPRVDLNGAYGHTAREPDDLDDTLFSDWFVGIGLRWEFFDGGRRRGQVAQIDSQKEQVIWQLAALRNQVEQQVASALTEYEAALSTWQAAEISATAAREASRVAGESYQEGAAIQADWLNAQEREIQAEVILVQAYYSARISAARLARAVGLQADEAWSFNPDSQVGDSEGEES